MDTLMVDVRGFPSEKISQLQRIIDRWKQEEEAGDQEEQIEKRWVDPSEFVPRKTKLKGKLTRALAYED